MSYNQYVTIEAANDTTDFVLFADDSGITLYNAKTSTNVWHIDKDS